MNGVIVGAMAPEAFSSVTASMAFLLGADASWVTGQVYGVHGGLGTVRSK